MSVVRNRAEPAGRELGKQLAQWCDEAEPLARLAVPDLPPRCNSCAFREGPHVANGSVATTMDVLKCLIEVVPFLCHQPDRVGCMCSGWVMMTLAHGDGVKREVAWPFYKQWGEWIPFYDRDREDPDWRRVPHVDNQMGRGAERFHNLAGGIGFHGDRVIAMRRVGKKAAGRLLDGREHNDFPVVDSSAPQRGLSAVETKTAIRGIP